MHFVYCKKIVLFCHFISFLFHSYWRGKARLASAIWLGLSWPTDERDPSILTAVAAQIASLRVRYMFLIGTIGVTLFDMDNSRPKTLAEHYRAKLSHIKLSEAFRIRLEIYAGMDS